MGSFVHLFRNALIPRRLLQHHSIRRAWKGNWVAASIPDGARAQRINGLHENGTAQLYVRACRALPSVTSRSGRTPDRAFTSFLDTVDPPSRSYKAAGFGTAQAAS